MVVGGSVGGGRVVGVKSMAAAACRNELSDGVIAFSLIGRRAARRRPADGAPPVRRPPHPPLDDLILFFVCFLFVLFVFVFFCCCCCCRRFRLVFPAGFPRYLSGSIKV